MGWIHFVRLIKKNMLMMLFFISLCVAIVSALSVWVIPKQYEAKVSLMIVRDPNAGTLYLYDELQAGLELIKDYQQILKTDVVLNEVKEKLSSELPSMKNLPNEDMQKRIVFDSVSDSRVFNILYRDTNNQTAQQVANKLAEVLKDKIAFLLQMDTLSILGPAELPHYPVSPNLAQNISITLVFSLVVSIVIIVLADAIKNNGQSK